MLLGDIAEIKTGLVLSRKKATIEFNVEATYKLLTLKNIDEYGSFNDEPFEEFQSSEDLEERYFTNEGDVLMRLSYPNTSICVGKKQSGLLVPSYFAIIKVDHNQFLPEFIAWYLNLDTVKKELERSQAGTRIPSTNTNVLKTISVSPIALHKQQTLTALLKLHNKEKELYEKLIKEKDQLFKALSQKIIQKSF
ncbi:restriction endonuclease [Sporosarcina globispora]|uniref:Restriction endonuclease n=1 Tax=Sporosarcina globispora TaxID=1459 RepID=A0A0M0G746_SPOGL|nr:restriction endonuclease subunit S [Sporosarcina globispora]KON85664.1 restriction endonuclease [Sporosarcina globispora]